MPHYGTLEDTFDRKEIKLTIEGWVNPVTIEFGYIGVNDVLYLHWRVKGTAHIFTIQSHQVNKMNATLEEHFSDALTTFRNDFISWSQNEFNEKWQREYEYMFRKFIIYKK